MLECFLCLSCLQGRLDQMVLECLSWRVQSTSWHVHTHLQYASISSASAELPLNYPEVTVVLCVCVLLCAQLFKGKFFHCEGLHVSNITNKTQCLEAGYRWARRKYNFDNLGQVCLRYAHVCIAALVRSPESLS